MLHYNGDAESRSPAYHTEIEEGSNQIILIHLRNNASLQIMIKNQEEVKEAGLGNKLARAAPVKRNVLALMIAKEKQVFFLPLVLKILSNI